MTGDPLRDALRRLRRLAFRAWRERREVEPREIVEIADEALGVDDDEEV